jgi:hypothetical protein
VFVENREAVLAALEAGRCDGILPAARSFLDGFAEFCLRAGVLKAFEAFPDHRARRSMPMFFFCNTLVHRPLWHLPRLQPIQDTLFRSPYMLRQLGVNARQIAAGFYAAAEGAKSFTAEAIADAFVRARPADFLANQQAVLGSLWEYCPGQFQSGLWAMDSVHFRVPRRAHTPEQAFELTELRARGTRVTIGVHEDMRIMEDMTNLSRSPKQQWEAAEPPQIYAEPQPQREIMSLPAMEAEWDACDVPLSACLIRDTYPNEVRYRGLVTTQPDVPAFDIHSDNGKRWTLEEVFVTLTRYWRFDDLPPCRLGAAYALSHFALLAYTLTGFYLQESDAALDIRTWNTALPPIPLPERELAVYARAYFALLSPSHLASHDHSRTRGCLASQPQATSHGTLPQRRQYHKPVLLAQRRLHLTQPH